MKPNLKIVLTVDQVLHNAIVELKKAGVPDPVVSANVLWRHVTGWTREQLLMARQDEVTQADVSDFQILIDQRATREPVAYITGQKEFYGRNFNVCKSVLVPRPETEALVDWAVKKYKTEKNIRICDVGTGSGVLAVTLAKELPQSKVTAVDISEEALAVAQKNGELHGVNVCWGRSDLLSDVTGSFDLVVANLPYVDKNDFSFLETEVQKEPHQALFADQQGYALLNKLIEQAYVKISPHGWIVLEHGQGQQDLLMKKMHETGWMHINGYNDLAGIDRMVTAQKSIL